jgi:hypothetical protein
MPDTVSFPNGTAPQAPESQSKLCEFQKWNALARHAFSLVNSISDVNPESQNDEFQEGLRGRCSLAGAAVGNDLDRQCPARSLTCAIHLDGSHGR